MKRIFSTERNKTIILLIISLLLLPIKILPQKKFNAKQVDSILNYYTQIPITGTNQQKYVNEIDEILPKISADSAKLVLLTKKSFFYGTNLKDQPLLLKNHLEAKKIIYSLKNSDKEKVVIHLGIAETYKYLKMYQLSKNNLDIAFSILKKLPKNQLNNALKYNGYFVELEVLFHLNQFDDCISKSQYILQHKRELQKPEYSQFAEMAANYFLGKCYLEKKQYSISERHLVNAEKLDVGILPDLTISINNNLARLLIEKRKYKDALSKLQNAGIPETSTFPEEYSERYQLLSKIYAQTGDKDRFNFYSNKRDSLDKSYKAVAMKAVEEAQLYTESELKKDINEKNNIIWIILPLGIIAFALMLYYIKKKKNDQTKYLQIIERIKNEAQKKQEIPADENLKIEKVAVVKNAPHNINENLENNILSGLQKFETLEKYRDQNLSLPSLAALLKTNTTYLSEIINKQKGKNYNAYINELRINYIVNKLYTDPQYLNYKISYLAEDCGFVSHSSFATIFKNILGISPSVFIQNLKNERSGN